MYLEENYIQLSALQHYLFCPRQCALAYLEMSWRENVLTALGRQMHEGVHSEKIEKRGGVVKASGLRLSSSILGISGQSDLVEFHLCKKGLPGVHLKTCAGIWRPFPVEYKRGKPKKDKSDEVQLCAQAICLEEMLKVDIPEGAIFYGKNKRRQLIAFDPALREFTAATARRVHKLFNTGITPPARYDARCKACSLMDICLPDKVAPGMVENYLHRMIRSGLCEKC